MPTGPGHRDPGGAIGLTSADSAEAWPSSPTAPAGAPNVLLVILDDVGFGQLGCYGGPVATPHIDGLAARGLRYANFHTCGICSPTRASLLTGRHAHAVGNGAIPEMSSGYPGYDAYIPAAAGTLAEHLRGNGYNTWALGKWHNTPVPETTAAGPFDRWPLGLGFESFYGFLGGMTSQWEPSLFRDNHPVDTPRHPGYHLSEDLAGQAASLIAGQAAVAPDKPFLLWLAFGACHAPHHAPREFIERYRGKFDHGWDRERELTFERQEALGLLPSGARIPPRNPGVPAWEELSAERRAVHARQQEVFAGFLEHTDAQLGRVLEMIERTGQLEDTVVMVVSDNGASADSGPEGVDQYLRTMDPEAPAPDPLPLLDELGGPEHVNEYAAGWAQAGNTPFRWFKAQVHGGGVRDPFIVAGPTTAATQGEVRHQFHHAVDVLPTILELAGVDPDPELRGVTQMPIHGVSMASGIRSGEAPSGRASQHFESLGNRAMYHEGWKAVTAHYAPYSGAVEQRTFEQDRWELFDLEADPSECADLAASEPEKLADLRSRWWADAGRFDVLPLDSSDWWERKSGREQRSERGGAVTYFAPVRIPGLCAPNLIHRTHLLRAEVELPATAEGVLCVAGERTSGFSFYVEGGRLAYCYSYLGRHSLVRSAQQLPRRRASLAVEIRHTGERAAVAILSIDGEPTGEVAIPLLAPVWFSLDAPFEVGASTCRPVIGAYECPFPFTGTIERLTVERAPSAERDPGKETELARRQQ